MYTSFPQAQVSTFSGLDAPGELDQSLQTVRGWGVSGQEMRGKNELFLLSETGSECHLSLEALR